jgi:aspartate-semialdehyde dehydrogenase
MDEILDIWKNYKGRPRAALPTAPKQFLRYFSEDNRPQTRYRDLRLG